METLRQSADPAHYGHRSGSGPSRRMGGPAFDLVASKLRRPPLRPGTVRRSPLIERLARGDPRPIVSVVAPAGYGKTTVFDLVAAKLLPPLVRPETIRWSQLLGRPDDGGARPIASAVQEQARVLP